MTVTRDALPLRDVRVLDLSRLLPGPFASKVLGDLGARVDKLEDLGAGDYLRTLPPLVGGVNAVFAALNRGKRSLALDLKSPLGRDAFLRLVGRYDVVLESFRPGTLAKLGLGPDTLRARQPRLVYCAISGYGADGPDASRAGHDLNYVARAGLLALQGPAGEVPQVPGFQVADIGGALYAAVSVLAALHRRASTGEGAFVDVSLCEAAASFGVFGLAQSLARAAAPRGADLLTGGLAPYATYRTQDGRYVALAALEPKFWAAFCEGAGLEVDLAALVPGAHQAAWRTRLEALFGSRSLAEWRAFAAARDVCLEPVVEPGDLVADAQHVARGLVQVDGEGGLALGIPGRGGSTALGPSPAHGEHTEEVLREAGFSADELAALVHAGVARAH